MARACQADVLKQVLSGRRGLDWGTVLKEYLMPVVYAFFHYEKFYKSGFLNLAGKTDCK